jgi:GntR family transcriptional regulator
MSDPFLGTLTAELAPGGVDDRPLAARLAERIWEAVVAGEIPTGSRLPTVRELAVALGTSPRTVERAYARLERLGVAHPRPGEGTFVSLAPPPDEERRRMQALADIARNAVARAYALGYAPDDLVEAVAEWRGESPPAATLPPSPEGASS